MTISRVILFVTIIFTSCGGNEFSDKNDNTENLIGKTFKTQYTKFYSLTFINENEVVYSYPTDDGDGDEYIYKYKLKDNIITLEGKDYSLEIYNQSIILHRWDPAKWDGKERGTTFILQ